MSDEQIEDKNDEFLEKKTEALKLKEKKDQEEATQRANEEAEKNQEEPFPGDQSVIIQREDLNQSIISGYNA